MVDASQIQEHMEVAGSDGDHVGIVDRVDADMIKLTKNDVVAHGEHQWIPLEWVSANNATVRLSKSRPRGAGGVAGRRAHRFGRLRVRLGSAGPGASCRA